LAQGLTVGLDLGDQKSRYCVLDQAGAILLEDSAATSQAGMEKHFGTMVPSRIAMEVGTHSRWVSEQLKGYGHEVIVANARKVKAISQSSSKNDRMDARLLAKLARIDPELLGPIRHRSAQAQLHLTLVRARAELVKARTALICSARGLVKSQGCRLVKCDTDAFDEWVAEGVPEELRKAILPMLAAVKGLTEKIKEYEQQIEAVGEKHYADELARVKQVSGVGTLTGLAYVLTLEDPERIERNRQVGALLGLRPRQRDSGESQPQLRITKEGDRYLRTLLVQSAQYILGPKGPDTDLQRFGRRLAARGGKNAKKRAVVAVARKLAVLLISLWKSGETYEPLRNSGKEQLGQQPQAA
jgi:transposase